MNGVSLEQASKETIPDIEVQPCITLKEHLQHHYDILMAEYTTINKDLKEKQDKKKNIDKEMDDNDYSYNTVRDNSGYYRSLYHEWQDNSNHLHDYKYKSEPRKSISEICSSYEYCDLLEKITKDEKQLIRLKNKLIVLNKKLNNSEQLMSLSRKELNEKHDWFSDKIILGIGTNAIGDSNASLHGNIDGGMDGASFLGFGSISGYVDGEINGHSNAKYEENILVKFKYNLDYKIDEILFDINNYL